MSNSLLIAIVGKPNVGKSTLFNRLSISKKAITHNEPGVTRDRIVARAKLGPLYFDICDSPGIELFTKDDFANNMTEQSLKALDKCDAILFVVDGLTPITKEDQAIADLLRQSGKQIFLLINKSENTGKLDINKDYYRLGIADMIMISASHGDGMADLCEELIKIVPESVQYPNPKKELKILLVGRPNVGKSSFVNSLLGEHRLFVDHKPGATRDAIQVDWYYKGQEIEIVDSAGLRKKTNIVNKIEKAASSESLRHIKFCDAVILMLDSAQPLSKQDLRIANIAIEEGRVVVIAVNKWDIASKENKKLLQKHFEDNIMKCLPQIAKVPIIYISAQTKYNIYKVIDAIIDIKKSWSKTFPTSQLNKWLNLASLYHPLPSLAQNKKVRLKYCTQIKSSPPTIRIFCNYPEAIQDSYKSYLRNYFREFFNMPACPIRFYFVKTNNPYAK